MYCRLTLTLTVSLLVHSSLIDLAIFAATWNFVFVTIYLRVVGDIRAIWSWAILERSGREGHTWYVGLERGHKGSQATQAIKQAQANEARSKAFFSQSLH